MKKTLFKSGFTLIELLVVIAIIGILTAIVTANFTTARARARDAKRVSDVNQIQLALEQAFDKCSVFPSPAEYAIPSNSINGCLVSGTKLSDFIAVIPKDPTTLAVYNYAMSGTDYVIQAKLESSNAALTDAPNNNNILNLDCTKTSPSFYYCVQPK